MARNRNYYIAPKDLVLAYGHMLIPFHYIDLEDGMVLVSANFSNNEQQDMWEELGGVTHVEDSIIEANTITPAVKVSATVTTQDEPKHVKHLKGKLGVTKEDTFKDVIKKAKAIHRLM